MKKLFTVFLILTGFANTTIGQTNLNHYVLETSVAGNAPQFIGGTLQTADGGTLVATSGMYVGAISAFTYGFSLIKFDAQGNKTWNKFLYDFATQNVKPGKILELADGSFVMIGMYSTTSFAIGTGFLLKTTATGDVVFMKILSGPAADLQLDPSDGGFLIAGDGGSPLFTQASTGGYLLKTDASGNTMWSHKVNYTQDNDYYYAAKPLADGSYLAVGLMITTPSAVYGDGIVAKYSATGALLWTKSYSSSGLLNAFTNFTELPDNSILLTGIQNQFMTGNSASLVRIDAAGNLLWAKTYGLGTNLLYAFSGSDVYGSGTVETAGMLQRRPFTAKFNDNGDLLWMRLYKFSKHSPTFGMTLGIDAVYHTEVRNGRLSFNSINSVYTMDTAITSAGCYVSDSSFATTSFVPTVTTVTPLVVDTSTASSTFSIATSSAVNFVRGDACDLANDVEETTPTSTTVFPNPASAFVNIQRSLFANAVYTVSDVTGRTVLAGTLLGQTTSIDIAALCPGLYLVNVGTQNKTVFKLVKN
jgi:hypothetical protein